MRKAVVAVGIPAGLHARPAARFVSLARDFSCDVWLGYADDEGSMVDAKSALRVLGLDANEGDLLVLEADGADEDRAIVVLSAFLRREGE